MSARHTLFRTPHYAQNISRNGYYYFYNEMASSFIIVYVQPKSNAHVDLSTVSEAMKVSAFQDATCCVRTHVFNDINSAIENDHTLW